MFTKNFWRQAAERALKSAAQALIGAGILDGANALHVDSRLAGGIVFGALVLSLLTSMVTSGLGEPGDPSAVKTTTN
jgi:hypothetical protein